MLAYLNDKGAIIGIAKRLYASGAELYRDIPNDPEESDPAVLSSSPKAGYVEGGFQVEEVG